MRVREQKYLLLLEARAGGEEVLREKRHINTSYSIFLQKFIRKFQKRAQKLGIAQGLTQGIEEGKESAAREIIALKATNEALHKQTGEILEQSNGNATGQLVTNETATKYLVGNRQLRNLVAAQER